MHLAEIGSPDDEYSNKPSDSLKAGYFFSASQTWDNFETWHNDIRHY
jgi:hypothetical protein